MSFVDSILSSLGPDVSKQLASQLDIDEKTAGQLLPKITPLILAGLKKQKDNGGAERVNHILNKYGNTDKLGDLAKSMQEGKTDEQVDSSLGGLLGDSGHKAAGLFANQLGIDATKAGRIIPMLAPLILSSLNKAKLSAGSSMENISSILDRDGDGKVLDDIVGFFGGDKSSSLLGGILGSVLGNDKK